MATRTGKEGEFPSGFAEPKREPQMMRMGHPEEGESRGETWALLRALILLVGVIVAIGYTIS